jgi:DnaJ-class molecular chaperone
MSMRCPECQGRGDWSEMVETANEVNAVWHHCEACHGTGVSQDADDGDDFDISGDSYADSD